MAGDGVPPIGRRCPGFDVRYAPEPHDQGERSDVEVPPRPGDLEAIDRSECVELLRQAPYVRIAFVTGTGPTVLPVNHVLFEDAIYFRTAPGSKLGMAAADAAVAIEADGGDDETTRIGWSVVAHGRASIVTDELVLERLLALPFEPWALPDDRSFWVRVDVDDISGRTIVRHAH